MPKKKKPAVGTITWRDVTLADATKASAFYTAVVGWKAEPFDMGGYNDYVMKLPKSGKTIAGVCTARGVNAKQPPQWMMYITVADLTASLRACRKHGGKVVTKTRDMGIGRFAVVQDPGGAVCALFEYK